MFGDGIWNGPRKLGRGNSLKWERLLTKLTARQLSEAAFVRQAIDEVVRNLGWLGRMHRSSSCSASSTAVLVHG